MLDFGLQVWLCLLTQQQPSVMASILVAQGPAQPAVTIILAECPLG